MILDMKKISLGKSIDDNALWVVEQIPTLVKSADTTSILRAGKKYMYTTLNFKYILTLQTIYSQLSLSRTHLS